MERPSYEQAWAEYRQALERLYESPVEAMSGFGEGDVVPEPEETLADRAENVVAVSQRLGEVIARDLEAEDHEQRELAELKLLSVASSDVAVANDLARRAQDSSIEATDRASELPGVMAEVRPILDVPLEQGIRGLMGVQLEAEQIEDLVTDDLPAAKRRLREAATGAVGSIQGDAARVCGFALSGLAPVPLADLQKVGQWVLSQLMDKIGEGASRLLRWAARLLASAVEKILKILPKDWQDDVRNAVLGWLTNLEKEYEGLWEKLLAWVYQTKDLRNEINQRIDGVPPTLDPTRLDAASSQAGQLADKFATQRRVLSLVVRGLGFANKWIIALPYGAIGLGAAYVIAIGYAVFAGGDYLDWNRPWAQYLDFVPGVLSVVRQATATA